MIFLIIVVIIAAVLVRKYEINKNSSGEGQVYYTDGTAQSGQNTQGTQGAWSSPQETFAQKAYNKAEETINKVRQDAPQIADKGQSARDARGYGARCKTCNSPLIGYGKAGGFCPSCKKFDYDRPVFNEYREAYGNKAGSLFVLMGYPSPAINLRSEGRNRSCGMYITPDSLYLKYDDGTIEILPYRDMASVTASKGAMQQLTIILNTPQGEPRSLSIDLKGSTYDGAGGEDLQRIKEFISENR